MFLAIARLSGPRSCCFCTLRKEWGGLCAHATDATVDIWIWLWTHLMQDDVKEALLELENCGNDKKINYWRWHAPGNARKDLLPRMPGCRTEHPQSEIAGMRSKWSKIWDKKSQKGNGMLRYVQVFSLALAHILDATLHMLSLALARNILDTRLQTFSLALAYILDATLQICGGMITQHANTMAS